VIATQGFASNTVNARSDDLLALEVETQPETDLLGKAKVKSSLKEDFGPEFEAHKSEDHPNCSLVRPVNPELSPDSPALLEYKKRRIEMEEIEHFLDGDFAHFGNFAPFLRRFKPGKERDVWLSQFFQKAHMNHDFQGDESLFNERCNQACHYVTLHDQTIQDCQGLEEFKEEYWRKEPKFDDQLGKYVSRPYNLGQCRRTSGPSHVVVGGGVALEPTSLYCEKPLGPSRYTGDATQRSSDDSQKVDRSSPIQCSGSRAESDRHNVDTDSEGFP
jgi:hypothetical protein